MEKQIRMCEEAEKALLEPIAPFLAYWELVQSAKKQMSILAKQRRHLQKQIAEGKFSTGKVDTQKQEE